MPAATVTLTALPGFPLVKPGNDLGALLIETLERAGLKPEERDILVVAQKIVSKAEGRYIDLNQITASERAQELARAVDKDPRLVEAILSESTEVVAHKTGVLVAAHKLGFVMANAGIDRSNLEPEGEGEWALLLPQDPDASAAALKTQMEARYGVELGVIVSDSNGRAWRNGVIGIALGAAGLPALRDMVGRRDLFGRTLEVTETGFADEIAAAASLLMGQADEGLPVVLVRGLSWREPPTDARALLRPKDQDMFR
ncbi:MAG: coenzyme F420-0:L-glutamate ligase [Alphaproteobacteria bacterium]